jgi:hypothetical protein
MSGFRVAELARWAVEADGVTLIHGGTGAALTLGYPRAAIWDFLTRGESCEQMGPKLCAIAACGPEAARALIGETLAALHEAGFVTRRDSRG